jgi:hypothetical protein
VTLDRREKALMGLNVATLQGLEIGPLHTPIVRRSDGRVIYVDHATTEDLKLKNTANPQVDISQIVDVDAVWGEQTLSECLQGRKVDYVVASHVIEHVPDLITWLHEIEEALTEGGQLRLLVPDKRYTFDVFRRPTSLADLLVAYLTRARRPSLQQVIDYALNVIYVEGDEIWRGEISERDLKHNNGLNSALDHGRRYLDTDEYIDVHAWAFAPRDFARLFERAARQSLIRFKCLHAFDTDPFGFEFIVHLQKCADPNVCADSWSAILSTIASSPLRQMVTEDGTISCDALTCAAAPSNQDLPTEVLELPPQLN